MMTLTLTLRALTTAAGGFSLRNSGGGAPLEIQQRSGVRALADARGSLHAGLLGGGVLAVRGHVPHICQVRGRGEGHRQHWNGRVGVCL